MNTMIFDEYGLVYCNGRHVQDPKSEYIGVIEKTLLKRNYYIYRLQFDPDKGIAIATWKWEKKYIVIDFENNYEAYFAVKAIFQEAWEQLEREDRW